MDFFLNYQWDSRKDSENRRKHRLALEDGIKALEDPNRQSWIDDGHHDELRFVTLGMVYPNILAVVTAQPSEEVTRIISVRKAERHEENWYHHGHP
jgi:uncharacterized DUF497 family protein